MDTEYIDAEFEIEISYEQYLTRVDLNEALKEIEYVIETEIRKELGFKPLSNRQVYGKYLHIKSVRSGSLLITALIFLGGFVASETKKGASQGRFGKRLQKMGEEISNRMDDIVVSVSKALKDLTIKLKEKGSRVKNIFFRKKSKNKSSRKTNKKNNSSQEANNSHKEGGQNANAPNPPLKKPPKDKWKIK